MVCVGGVCCVYVCCRCCCCFVRGVWCGVRVLVVVRWAAGVGALGDGGRRRRAGGRLAVDVCGGGWGVVLGMRVDGAAAWTAAAAGARRT